MIAASLALAAANASAQVRPTPARPVTVPAGPMGAALSAVARQTGADVLFSPAAVAGKRTPGVRGTLTADAALDRLLSGSGLTYQRTSEGVFVIVAAPPDPPIPEILVIGVRTQNADIRRTVNEIQPYRVSTAADIRSSHADTVGEYLATRLPSNQITQSPAQNLVAENGSTRSQVDLHGLGANQTLVLVDGIRMPRLPFPSLNDFLQADLNGLPLTAVERIETLTSTAGGIFGPGATGGVVNVVLKRDYRGADLTATSGMTTRGDAQLYRISGRVGFTPDHGRTDVMIALSRSDTRPLRIGERDYRAQAYERRRAADPAAFAASEPYVNAVVIQNLGDGQLSLRPDLGGASLGANYTYLPIGSASLSAGGLAALLANAGRAPIELSTDGNGAIGNIVSRASTWSLLLNVRHRFSAETEAFLDFIHTDNRGRAIVGNKTSRSIFVSALSPTNPFKQLISASIPLPGYDTTLEDRTIKSRLSAGLIVQLPWAWRLDGTAALGSSTRRASGNGFAISSAGKDAIYTGQGVNGAPAPDPFGDYQKFLSAADFYRQPDFSRSYFKNRFSDFSTKVAGPLFSTPGGTVTLTMLAEARKDEVRPGSSNISINGLPAPTYSDGGASEEVRSLYGEVRAPIVSRQSAVWPLRGLEFQFAARKDAVRVDVPQRVGLGSPTNVTARFASTVYTAGLRAFPSDGIMVRASLATGIVPPGLQSFIGRSDPTTIRDVADPKRGGSIIGSEGPIRMLSRGSVDVQPERARAVSLGFVLNPEGRGRPRVSIDYTRIAKSHEVVDTYSARASYFIANEAVYPDRVTRGPLTSADVAAGYTGGIVTLIDTTYLNIGTTVSDAVDANVDYTLDVRADSSLRVYGSATWEPRLRRQSGPDGTVRSYVGSVDGPLRWRGNAGVDWTFQNILIGLNGQFYASYRTANAIEASLGQMGARIPSQAYLDLTAAYSLAMPGFPARTLDLRLGVQNVLDHSPPIVVSNAYGYSFFGDPRRRRFDLTAAVRF